MTITKEQIDKKLEELNKNKLVVQDRIKTASETIKQANADLNALAGAIQVCEQLLSEQSSEDEDGGTN
jgi:multidrug resistance efflux pump